MLPITWIKFVNDAEFVIDNFGNVNHIKYHEIEIHPTFYNFNIKANKPSNVGAYNCIFNSPEVNYLILYFENHGVIICSIANAFQKGYWQNENLLPEDLKNLEYNAKLAVFHAFEKGRKIGCNK